MEDWTTALANLSTQLQQISNSNVTNLNSYSSVNTGNNAYQGSSKSSGDNDKYNISEQRAYNSDKSTYSKYDSMLSQTFAGNRTASASEINQWKNKMRALRKNGKIREKVFHILTMKIDKKVFYNIF